MNCLRACSTRLYLPLLLLLISSGCGKTALQTVPVSGQITLNKGAWPKPGLLYFSPIESAPGFPVKPGSAKFDSDGRFTARTKADGDGLVPGKYYVNVECYLVQPSANPDDPPGKSSVPAKYQSGAQSGFIVEVPADAKHIDVHFDIPAK
jgi:hypothetical protein